MRNYLGRFVFVSMLLLSCTAAWATVKPVIKEGIAGRIYLKKGNFMPSPDAHANKGQGKPVKRTLLVYELTNQKQAVLVDRYYTKINSKLVARVTSNSKGYYKLKLKPGTYSIFAVEGPNKYYANISDGDGNIAPCVVKAKQVTKLDVILDADAVY